MKAAGIPSQRQLAFKANLRPATITRWVQEETKSIHPNDLGSVCAVLGVRPEWLLLEAGPMQEEGARESATPYRADTLDALLLGQCFVVVADALGQRTAPCPPAAKVGAIMAEVYSQCLREGKEPTPEMAAPLIRVVLA